MPSISATTSLGRRCECRVMLTRMSARRPPRVATTVDVRFSTPNFGHGSHVRRLASRPCSDTGVHHPTAIAVRNVIGQVSAIAAQSRAAKYAPKAFDPLACRVFQPLRRRVQLFEPRERGVKVCLVENFAAVDQIAFDRQDVDPPATRLRSLLAKSLAPAWVTTAPERCSADAQSRCRSVSSGVRSQMARMFAVIVAGFERGARRWSTVAQSRHAGSSCRLNAA